MIQLLSEHFNISVDYLLGKTDTSNPTKLSLINNNLHNLLVNDIELADFIEKLTYRSELQLIAKHIKDLTDESIARLRRIIDAIEMDKKI
jgi:predicted transcriptional regulator